MRPSFAVARKPDRDALIERLREFRGRMPADFKFDRDEANAGRAHCDRVWSADMQDGMLVDGRLTIFNPFRQ